MAASKVASGFSPTLQVEALLSTGNLIRNANKWTAQITGAPERRLLRPGDHCAGGDASQLVASRSLFEETKMENTKMKRKLSLNPWVECLYFLIVF